LGISLGWVQKSPSLLTPQVAKNQSWQSGLREVQKTTESVEKLGSEQILFAVTIPCRATGYFREEHRR